MDPCTSLESLTFRLHIARTIYNIAVTGMPWEPFIASLPRLSPAIREITVNLCSGQLPDGVRFLRDTEKLPWAGVEDRVDSFINLRGITFNIRLHTAAIPSLLISPEDFYSQFQEILIRNLPRLYSRDLLHFSITICPDPLALDREVKE